MRIVLSVAASSPTQAPLDALGRSSYCGYLANIVKRFTTIKDVVVWNEPNLSLFWRPQFNPDGTPAAPKAYEALLAECYDDLHAVQPQVNVIAPATCPRGTDIAWESTSISVSPGEFIIDMGEAYRASGRTRPLFDTIGHHVYGTTPAERPWRVHSDSTAIAEGDLNTLLDAFQQGFAGTPQPLPGQGVSIWYLEAGYQTTVPASKAAFYYGVENIAQVLPPVGGPPDPPNPSATSPAPGSSLPTASRTWARFSTSCSSTIRISPATSRRPSGPTGRRSRRTRHSATASPPSKAERSTAVPLLRPRRQPPRRRRPRVVAHARSC
jgi:hypothetical protein